MGGIKARENHGNGEWGRGGGVGGKFTLGLSLYFRVQLHLNYACSTNFNDQL